MKKTFSFILAYCLLLALVYAQAPTITNSALPSVGDAFTNVKDTSFVVTMTPPSMTPQTWTYNPGSDRTKVNSFIAPTGLPGAIHFPSANMANQNTLDSEVVYFVKNSSGLYADGLYVYRTGEPITNVPIDYAPKNQMMLPTPMTLGYMGADTSKAVALFNYLGNDVKLVTNVYKTYYADAYGTLTIPSGTYTNTLRVRETSINRDTVYLKVGPLYYYLSDESDTAQVYHWLQNTNPIILLSMNMKKPFTLNQSKTAEYNTITTSQKDNVLLEEKVKTYPNPVQNVLYLNMREANNIQTIRIVDITGKTVLNENIAGYDVATVSMVHYPAGVYIYQLYDSNGNLKQANKFIKQ
jgi:hypothetical protein